MPASARLRQVFRSNLGATIDLEPFLANVAETTFPQRYQGCGTISALVIFLLPHPGRTARKKDAGYTARSARYRSDNSVRYRTGAELPLIMVIVDGSVGGDPAMNTAVNESLQAEVLTLVPAIRRFAYRFERDPADAEDLAQETLSKALGHLDQYTVGTSLKSWCFTIMRNTFLNNVNRRKRHVLVAEVDDSSTTTGWCNQEAGLYATQVWSALSTLPLHQKNALLMVLDGLTYEQIAAAFECEMGTAKSRIARARSALAAILGEINPTAAVTIPMA